MIKVILADDEPIIIKGLQKLINWSSLGMEIIGQASEGNELMRMLEQNHPDLIISDIKMPNMTGIDIIKTIKENALPVKVIFISAYQEFSYARDAVSYGALDYLLKPIRRTQLEQVLLRAARLITEEHEDKLRQGKLKHLEKKVHLEQREEGISRLIEGTLSKNSDYYPLICNVLRGPQYCIGIMDVEWGEVGQKWNDKETRLALFAVGNILNELITEPAIGQVLLYGDKYVYICGFDNEQDSREMAKEIHRNIRQYLKLGSTIGISSMIDQLFNLPDAYQQARYANDLKYFLGIDKVIEFNGAPLAAKSRVIEIYSLQRQAAIHFIENDQKMGMKIWKELLEMIRLAHFGDRTLAISTCLSSLLYLVQELEKSGLLTTEQSVLRDQAQVRLSQLKTYNQVLHEMIRIVEDLLMIIENESGNKEKAVLAKVKQFIETHYHEEVTLESVANITYMNSSYFSFFFKKHTGKNFKQYLTEVRLKHAIRMLLHTDFMVYEIAEKVGYHNPRHFSDIFRKAFGQLPNEYRQDKGKNN
ncbi:response regulator [Paenibacillus sp. FSL R5-0517]|uniref:response regulator n=1 Tax=Paenibacillus sp. FSL R5-0517 TaxID=2921647 RepID=UPI0030DCDB54